MDLGTVLSVAQTLFAALQCSELREFCNILGYKSELEKLERTVKIVKAVLEEAESKEELPPQAQLYVDQLKEVVFDADDLLDEFVTLAQRKKHLIREGKISEKLSLLFSRFNPLATARKMSQGVKEIRKRLDEIASEHTKFGFKLDSKPILRRREETCSSVDSQDIIGREEDVEEIVGKLLDPDNVQQGVSCLAIVGIGGLGKTALAQLIYNDARVQQEFPLRSWTCVSDQDQKDLDKKLVVCKVLESLTSTNKGHLSMESLQKQLQDHIAGKKCLIILDDLWNESRRQLVDMAKLLKIGLRGSWIVVTTRSELTASILGGEHVHKLKGLSEEESWKLFEMTALGQGDGQQNTSDLVDIGRDIVKRCANVPLAIRVVGSLLYGHSKEKWVAFQNKGLGTLKDAENDGIGPILKLSYRHLESPLKTCFSYCAIFPKDRIIFKEMLINLWLANDYIVPLEEGQSVEDAGNEYFSILVRRCFFQDVVKDVYGESISFKIHDLMHDLAQDIAGKEICVADSFMTDMDHRIRHMSYRYSSKGVQGSFTHSRIRTCLCTDWGTNIPVGELLRKWTCLRALNLRSSGIKRLPSAIGKLLHLRYLDLSENAWLEVLPNSITNLHNLQTLNLHGCDRLKALPNDLSKLVKLRVLDIDPYQLNSMPRGLGKLSCLRTLPLFVVGDNNSTSKQNMVDQMEELKGLTSLKGSLRIMIKKNNEYTVENGGQRGYIQDMKLLTGVEVFFDDQDWEEQLLLEDLKPHPNLRKLELFNYNGVRLPSWAVEDNLASSLPNLVHLRLYRCTRLEHLPSLRKMSNLKSLVLQGLDELEYIESTMARACLRKLELFNYNGVRLPSWAVEDNLAISLPNLVHLILYNCTRLECLPSLRKMSNLKSLVLQGLDALEYIENTRASANVGDFSAETTSETLIFFSSLKKLQLVEMHKLKGWWREEHITDDNNLLLFPHLSKLKIQFCPNLACILACPAVEKLVLKGELNENLRIKTATETRDSKLRILGTDNVGHLGLSYSLHVVDIRLSEDSKVESLSKVGEMLLSSLSSLQFILIYNCPKLKSVSGLEHLTTLESLQLERLPSLRSLTSKGEEEEDSDDGMPWRCLAHSLRDLKLWELDEVVKLSNGMRYLTALQSLEIRYCEKLEEVPEWMPELTSLKTLHIINCSDSLHERCRNPTGQDWPYIRHIPNFTMYQLEQY